MVKRFIMICSFQLFGAASALDISIGHQGGPGFFATGGRRGSSYATAPLSGRQNEGLSGQGGLLKIVLEYPGRGGGLLGKTGDLRDGVLVGCGAGN